MMIVFDAIIKKKFEKSAKNKLPTLKTATYFSVALFNNLNQKV